MTTSTTTTTTWLCSRCGVPVSKRGARCLDCARMTYAPPPREHKGEVTHMLNGKYRAECWCGWWADHDHEDTAKRAATIHASPAQRTPPPASITPTHEPIGDLRPDHTVARCTSCGGWTCGNQCRTCHPATTQGATR